MHVNLIETRSALEDFIASVEQETLLAIDTEFFRETTYFPKLGLVQLASRKQLACIDPLAFDARDGLARLLLNPDITKLFHSCSQDLEVLLQYLGALPCPVIDTQIASAMQGEKDQISYANLVAEIMHVELDKSQTRTNWLKRPLSSKQLEYAAEDVLYLIPVYEQLEQGLRDNGRLHWLQQDCEQLCRNVGRFEPDFDRVWLRVKGTQKCRGEQLAIIDALARWREHKAIALDLTRRQVLSDDLITAAAFHKPADSTSLLAHGKAHRRLGQEDYAEILQLIQTAAASDPDSWPSPPAYRLSPEQKALIKRLMAVLETTASELGIAQAVLGSRKDIEKLINGERDLAILKNWRRQCVGERLLALVVESQ